LRSRATPCVLRRVAAQNRLPAPPARSFLRMAEVEEALAALRRSLRKAQTRPRGTGSELTCDSCFLLLFSPELQTPFLLQQTYGFPKLRRQVQHCCPNLFDTLAFFRLDPGRRVVLQNNS